MNYIFRVVFCLSSVGLVMTTFRRILSFRQWPPPQITLSFLLALFVIPIYPIKQNSEITVTSIGEMGRIDISDLFQMKIPCEVWIIGVIISTILFIFRNIILGVTIKDGLCEVPPHIQIIADDICNELQIQQIPIYYKADLLSPIGLGIAKKRIILSKESLELYQDGVELLLRHELYHFKRKHIVIKMLMNIVRIVHWFNISIYYLNRAISQCMESACDKFAVADLESDDREYYCELLINLQRGGQHSVSTINTEFSGEGFYSAVTAYIFRKKTAAPMARRLQFIEQCGNEEVNNKAAVNTILNAIMILLAISVSAFFFEITEEKIYIIDQSSDEQNVTYFLNDDSTKNTDELVNIFENPIKYYLEEGGENTQLEYNIYAFLGCINVLIESEANFNASVYIYCFDKGSQELIRTGNLSADENTLAFEALDSFTPYRLVVDLKKYDSALELQIGG